MQTLKMISEPTFKAGTFAKRIGSTVYKVNIHFNRDAKETMDEKILRMVKNDLSISQENVTMKALQTEWLPERSLS